MQLNIDEQDAIVLRDMLAAHLQELRFEVARTDRKDFRHELVLRQEVLERLLVQLERDEPIAETPLVVRP